MRPIFPLIKPLFKPPFFVLSGCRANAPMSGFGPTWRSRVLAITVAGQPYFYCESRVALGTEVSRTFHIDVARSYRKERKPLPTKKKFRSPEPRPSTEVDAASPCECDHRSIFSNDKPTQTVHSQAPANCTRYLPPFYPLGPKK